MTFEYKQCRIYFLQSVELDFYVLLHSVTHVNLKIYFSKNPLIKKFMCNCIDTYNHKKSFRKRENSLSMLGRKGRTDRSHDKGRYSFNLEGDELSLTLKGLGSRRGPPGPCGLI